MTATLAPPNSASLRNISPLVARTTAWAIASPRPAPPGSALARRNRWRSRSRPCFVESRPIIVDTKTHLVVVGGDANLNASSFFCVATRVVKEHSNELIQPFTGCHHHGSHFRWSGERQRDRALCGDPAKSLHATFGHGRHVNWLVGRTIGQRIKPSKPQKILNDTAESLGLMGDPLKRASKFDLRTRGAQSQTHLRFNDAKWRSQLVRRVRRELKLSESRLLYRCRGPTTDQGRGDEETQECQWREHSLNDEQGRQDTSDLSCAHPDDKVSR